MVQLIEPPSRKVEKFFFGGIKIWPTYKNLFLLSYKIKKDLREIIKSYALIPSIFDSSLELDLKNTAQILLMFKNNSYLPLGLYNSNGKQQKKIESYTSAEKKGLTDFYQNKLKTESNTSPTMLNCNAEKDYFIKDNGDLSLYLGCRFLFMFSKYISLIPFEPISIIAKFIFLN